ncbi:hypothetical protein M231_04912 [Tremella mesenterica]|uniref:Mitochondrial import protein 1 n=1 Tax=Tremella mesenterica TaxID=5217 RepID=A0A4Q1BJR2_TREME|nr:hypothetical protein M231_04912 [Tremella mesenterica]
MSDTREQAQEVLDDALGSSLESSFSPPPLPPPPSTDTTQPFTSAQAAQDQPPTQVEPVEGLDTWPETYESYLRAWHAESAVAREKAAETRARIEKERAAELQAIKEKEANEKKVEKEREELKRKREKLLRELSEPGPSKRVKGDGGDVGEKEKMKEAWELVHDDTADAAKAEHHGVTETAASDKNQLHTEPLESPLPPPKSTATSRHSATSGAWEELSLTPSSAEDLSPPRSTSDKSGEEMMSIPRTTKHSSSLPSAPSGKPSAPEAGIPKNERSGYQPAREATEGGHPSQPPSLTLSIFTSPSHLSISRVLAVLGINVVLPFINGVMLGFGEIFAREVVRVSKVWWGGKRSPGSVGSVGLRGSGGF